jgi:uncharacterized protein YidB (DUF937 family)
MGFLDDIVGAVSGGDQGKGSQLVGTVKNLLGDGRLSALVSKFEAAGLGDKVQSWIGTGENEAVSPDEVKQALGHDQLSQAAEQMGVTSDEAADRLARALPGAVDGATPDGTLPADDSA